MHKFILRLWSFVCFVFFWGLDLFALLSFWGYDLFLQFDCKNLNFFCLQVVPIQKPKFLLFPSCIILRRPRNKSKTKLKLKTVNFFGADKNSRHNKRLHESESGLTNFFLGVEMNFSRIVGGEKKEVLQSRETVSVFPAMSFEVFVLIRRCSVEREAEKWKIMRFFIFTQLDTILWMHNITYSIVSAFCSLYYIILG